MKIIKEFIGKTKYITFIDKEHGYEIKIEKQVFPSVANAFTNKQETINIILNTIMNSLRDKIFEFLPEDNEYDYGQWKPERLGITKPGLYEKKE